MTCQGQPLLVSIGSLCKRTHLQWDLISRCTTLEEVVETYNQAHAPSPAVEPSIDSTNQLTSHEERKTEMQDSVPLIHNVVQEILPIAIDYTDVMPVIPSFEPTGHAPQEPPPMAELMPVLPEPMPELGQTLPFLATVETQENPAIVQLTGRLLGRGGMALVYEAKELSGPSGYAVKVARTDLSIEGAGERQIDNEMAMVHLLYEGVEERYQPGIQGKPFRVTVLDSSGQPLEGTYYLQPICHGTIQDLADFEKSEAVFKRAGITRADAMLTPEEKLKGSLDLMAGLTKIHEKGLHHGDLKSANCLVRFLEGTCLIGIADFGGARFLDQCRRDFQMAVQRLKEEGVEPSELSLNTQAGKVLGVYSQDFLHPEDLVELKDCLKRDDEEAFLTLIQRMDVYALGCVLYHLWTTEIPFFRSTGETLIQNMESAQCPSWLAEQISAMLQRPPKERLTIE